MWDELRNLREGHGLTQNELGDRLGLSGASICAWENEIPSKIANFRKLCEVLDSSPNALLGWEEQGTTTIVHKEVESPFSSEDIVVIRDLLTQHDKRLREDLIKHETINEFDVAQINKLASVLKKVSQIYYDLCDYGAFDNLK